MNAEFYLFNVDHGQSAALRLPNGRWCIFDLGRTSEFSPVNWVVDRAGGSVPATLLFPATQSSFRFLKATVSHLHNDHLADHRNLFLFGPEFMRTVVFDNDYLSDCIDSAAEESRQSVFEFAQRYPRIFSGNVIPDYGAVTIREFSLSVSYARAVGGSANSRVNNASIITRIDVHGNSILLCGDLEKEGWEAIFGDQSLSYQRQFMLSDIDVLIAPHHGHASAYSVDLLNSAKPAVVLISVVERDPHVDSRYSQSPIRGIRIGNTNYNTITTRDQGHIKISIAPPDVAQGATSKGARTWTFGQDAVS
jgi:hypothetical protein